MMLNGIDSAEKYFDKIVFLMINNNEEGVFAVNSEYRDKYPLSDIDFVKVFCDSITKMIDLKNITESYALYRKSLKLFRDNDIDDTFVKKLLLEQTIAIIDDKESPLIKILS